MPDYRNQKYMPNVKSILGGYLLTDSTFEEDTQQATDLTILRVLDKTIAVRVREPGYWGNFQYEFTIRSLIEGVEFTEIDKILRGWGGWFFYGHGDGASEVLHYWLICLSAFRFHHSFSLPFIRTEHHKPNGDGTFFDAFDLRKFPSDPGILIGSSDPLPRMVA